METCGCLGGRLGIFKVTFAPAARQDSHVVSRQTMAKHGKPYNFI
jgi:hypothetical protein